MDRRASARTIRDGDHGVKPQMDIREGERSKRLRREAEAGRSALETERGTVPPDKKGDGMLRQQLPV